MKFANHLTICAVVLAFLDSVALSQTPDKQLFQVQECLKLDAIKDILLFVDSDHFIAPSIPSLWRTGFITNMKEQDLSLRARQLGLKIATLLSREAIRLRQKEDVDTLYARTNELIDLAEWLTKVDGYGNMLLSARAMDLASIGAATLISDIGKATDFL